MTAFVIAFDTASHAAAVEKRIQTLAPGQAYKLLDSVWFLRTAKTGEQIYEHVNSAMGAGDRLIVVQSAGATYRDLLAANADLVRAGL